MTSLPNLYGFATKELAQDATVAYILAWAHPDFRESHPRLHALGTALLQALVRSHEDWTERALPAVSTLEVETQVQRIDILARVNLGSPDGYLLWIEDKVKAHEHSNQIERYMETAEKLHPDVEIVPVYLKTGNESRHSLPPKEKCGCFLRADLLRVLEDFTDTGDTIVDNFRTHLHGWEAKTKAYLTESVSSWRERWSKDWRGYEGLYMALEADPGLADPGLTWNYVSNPAKGFLHFAFGTTRIETETGGNKIYLQIESGRYGTRLTVRLAKYQGEPKVRAPAMYRVWEGLQDAASRFDGDIRLRKAGRFRGGDSAAVAEVQFGGDNYVATLNDGRVDMAATVRRLVAARTLVSEFAHTSGTG